MKRLIIICTMMFMCMSCSDFLNKQPETTLSPEYFWNTESDLQMGVNFLYTTINYAYTDDNRSTDTFAGSANAISSGTYTPPNTDATWTNMYTYIRIANDFLENYETAEVSDEIKARYAGEARFFRAFFYYALVIKFGDVPLVTTTLDLNSQELTDSRTPKKEVWDLIFDDLDYAVANLPLASGMSVRNDRISKGAAQAFLARVALYAGTHYKYHTGSDTYGYLQKAYDAAVGVMESGEYDIYSDYRNLFLTPGENSVEHILFYRYDASHGTMNTRSRLSIYDYDCEPTKYMADNFLCKDGLPIEKSEYAVEYLPVGTEFENRDPRMALTLWEPGSDYSDAPFLPNFQSQTTTGYIFKKYALESAYTYDPDAVYIDNILIRYAEVLLVYAEACYELNGAITDQQLDVSINRLRERFAGDPNQLPSLTNDFVTEHGLDMLEMIRCERRAELSGEGLRYHDIIRWKIADQDLDREILGVMFDQDAYPSMTAGEDINVDSNGFVIVQTAASRTYNESKAYLYPIPLREISLNANLTQNPGWE